MPKKILLVAFTACGLGLALGGLLANPNVFADGNPTTDDVPRLIPYQGMLEQNGEPVNATGFHIRFQLYDGVDAEVPVYTQDREIDVYNGRFTTTIGPVDNNNVPIATIIAAADDLHLGLTLLNDINTPEDDLALSNRQQILATPYAMWTTSATDLTVANNATVGGMLETTHLRTASIELTGSDLVLGTNDGRPVGDNTAQRALAHSVTDALVVNFENDFEGGVDVQSDARISGDAHIAGQLTADSLGTWPDGNYCILRNGGSCPTGFGNETIILSIGTHGHAICPNPAGDTTPDSAGDTTMRNLNGAGWCQVDFRLCCK